MCTAVCEWECGHLFGRTLDLEYSLDERVVLLPRRAPLCFLREGAFDAHLAMLGTAHQRGGMTLYYDAVNEAGLAMAALNFGDSAVYHLPCGKRYNVASFELIPFLLGQCRTVVDAVKVLLEVNVVPDSVAHDLPATPLHWLLADKTRAVTVESTKRGLEIHENPFGVLTNAPDFSYHVGHLSEFLGLSPTPPENHLCPEVPIEPYSRGMGAVGLPGDWSSASRFVRAVFAKHHTAREESEEGKIGRFFHIMDTVSVPNGAVRTDQGEAVRTVYTSCAELGTQTYYFCTYESRRIRAVRMRDYSPLGERAIVFSMGEREEILIKTPQDVPVASGVL